MKNIVTSSFFMLALVALTTSEALQAQILYSTDFSSPLYTEGNLLGQNGWAAHSGQNSISVQVSNPLTNGVITLNQGTGTREDVNRNLGATIGANETWQATFDVTVTGGNTAVYFAHFLAGSSHTARAFITSSTLGGDFNFGISSSATSADRSFAMGFTYGTTYTLTLGYNRATGISTLHYAGTTIESTTTNSLNVSSIAFRQAEGNSVQVIDNLTVRAIPEPTSFVMIPIAASMIFLRSRTRRKA